jgi:hypothetical protein
MAYMASPITINPQGVGPAFRLRFVVAMATKVTHPDQETFRPNLTFDRWPGTFCLPIKTVVASLAGRILMLWIKIAGSASVGFFGFGIFLENSHEDIAGQVGCDISRWGIGYSICHVRDGGPGFAWAILARSWFWIHMDSNREFAWRV